MANVEGFFCRQTDGQTERHTNRQTDEQTDRHDKNHTCPIYRFERIKSKSY